jgi:thioredoxin-like negative regulator of GroEL
MVVIGVGLLALAAAPVRAQELPWRTDYTAARREAREKNLPVLVDFGTTSCFWCKKLEQTTFRDPAVVRKLRERFVLLKVNADKEPKLAQALGVRSYPTLIFAAPDGKILGAQEGYVTAPALSKLLGQALALATARGPAGAPQVAGSSPAAAPAGPDGVVPASAVVASPERVQAARLLLALAQGDFQKEHYVSCLERCRELAAGCPDLPEGAEARRLAGRVRGEPELVLRACADLSDRLAELYLGLAEGLLRQGQVQQALPYLEQVVLVCPGSRHAEAARGYLARLQSGPAAGNSGPGPSNPSP